MLRSYPVRLRRRRSVSLRRFQNCNLLVMDHFREHGVEDESSRDYALICDTDLSVPGATQCLTLKDSAAYRLNDDCLYSAAASVPQDMIDDGNDVRQALAGSGAGREDVIPASPRPANRVGL